MKKIIIAVLVLAVAAGGGIYWYINDRARTMVDERLDAMVANGDYDRAEYETLNIAPSGDISMTNLHLVQGPLDYTLQDIKITNLDYANEVPRHFDLAVNGLRVEPIDVNQANPQTAALAGFLQRLGTGEEIPLQLNYSHRYDPDNAFQTDSDMTMSVPELFTLNATTVTRNVDFNAFNNIDDSDPAVAQQQTLALLQKAEFPSMRIVLQDQGFVAGMIATSAADAGVQPEELRNLLMSQARNLFLFLPPTAQNLGIAIGNEAAEFLEGGKTLSITVTPEYGGSFEQLQAEIMGAVFTGDYDKVSELLHLEVLTE